jgi:putative NADH-flavin reductase
MKVALIGASGNLGSRVMDELLERGHQVTAIVRDPEKLAGRTGITVRMADAAQPDQVTPFLVGHDAIITAIPFLGFRMEDFLEAVRRSGVKRLLVSGTAATLEIEPGVQYIEGRMVSEHAKPEHLDAREAFKVLRKQDELEWTYLAPAALLTPGKRTGEFRLGANQLIKDRLGESRISMEDLAIVLVNELEQAQHIRQRFTAAY